MTYVGVIRCIAQYATSAETTASGQMPYIAPPIANHTPCNQTIPYTPFTAGA